MNNAGPHVLVVQHLPHEHAGVLGEALTLHGCRITTCEAWHEPVPATPQGVDALVVLGGDMNTDEETRWPHLGAARSLLAATIERATPALGICLGAQLLAEATGGRVVHGRPEIGWVPVRLTPSGRAHPVLSAVPDATAWFSAHGDQILTPPGATLLAFSEESPVQAFAIGSGLGLQFHPEIDASYVAGYVGIEGISEYLSANGWSAEALLEQARRRNEDHRTAGSAMLGAWVRTLARGQRPVVHNRA